MRIAFIGTVPSSLYGFRGDLIKLLVSGGHTVFALSSSYDEQSKKKVIALGAIPVDYAINRGGSNPFSDFFAMLRLAKQLRKMKLDVCFSYFVKPVIFGTLAAKLAQVPRKIAMLEGLGYAFTEVQKDVGSKRKFLKFVQIILYKFSLPIADHVIFLNPDDRNELIKDCKINLKRSSILGGIGLDLASYFYSGPKFDPFRFIFVGRLLREKGINEFVSAARIVKEKYPDTEFVVLGRFDASNPGGLSEIQMNELMSAGVISYPGHVSDMTQRLQSSTVFVLPSYREGVPRSTQEAMAVGLPVITTDVPGCRETVIDGVTGFLVKPWSVEELVEKMEYFLHYPQEARNMGIKGYEMAKEKFDVNKTNEKLLKVIFGS
ncbi:glycosyltransferase family 4 protein [Kerstersia gyiorum]|uniref:glycosyltransferase family 4 protein n=1 Tax=Kerstersia gyiorum TaxID=206506 RepID=UPI003B42F093